MILPDYLIRKAIEDNELVVTPHDVSLIQPASLDVRLGNQFISYVTEYKSSVKYLDPEKDNRTLQYKFTAETIYMSPGDFLLGTTLEYFEIPPWLKASVEGKSTIGRCGLSVHLTAGYIDPGFKGNITLELKNDGPLTIRLRHGMRIGQLSFTQMLAEPERPYGYEGLGSHYQGQRGVTGPVPLK